MIRLPIDKVRDTIRYYIKKKIPYTAIVTHSRVTIVSKSGSVVSKGNTLPAGELNFIKQVKWYIVSNNIHTKLRSGLSKKNMDATPVYYSYNTRLMPGECFINNVYNIDISSAYWVTAYRLGLLSDELFTKGMDTNQISKKTRLAAIGSLAKKSTTYEFDGKVERLVKKDSQETEFIWNLICNIVGDILKKAAEAAGDSFIFFWVDGIYVSSKQSATKMSEFFNSLGYQSVISELESIKVTQSSIMVLQPGEDRAKPFPFLPKQVRVLKKLYQNKIIDQSEYNDMAELLRISILIKMINKYQ